MYTVIIMKVMAPIQQCLLLQISLLVGFYDFIIVYKALQFSYFFTISNHSFFIALKIYECRNKNRKIIESLVEIIFCVGRTVVKHLTRDPVV